MQDGKLFERNSELAKEINDYLRKKGQTIASAESCTGGLIASYLTEWPGSSLVYKGGVSCYSNFSKTELMHIPPNLFDSVGAVSKELAEALAKNIRISLKADYGLSTTGIAGPDGGTPGKPVGTVWCGISGPVFEKVWCLHLKGTRHSIRQESVRRVFSEFLNLLKGD